MGIWVSCRRLSSYVATRFGRFTPLRWLGTAPVNNCCPNTASAQALRDSNVGRLAAVSRSEWSTLLKSGMPRMRRAATRTDALPLKNRFNYHTLVLFYKMRQNLAPKYLYTLVPDLSSTTSGYWFRKFFLPCPPHKEVSNLGKFFTPSYYLMEWPSTNVQSSKTLSTFKTKLTVHLSL